ncbi:MAG: hypothetical protein ACI83O_000120 [Patescibacteria group bacterium]|jgi:hypothetical protein
MLLLLFLYVPFREIYKDWICSVVMREGDLVIVLLVFLCMSVFVVGQSSTEVDIYLEGCAESFGGVIKYAELGKCLEKRYYCNLDGVFEDVYEVANACSMQDTSPSDGSTEFARGTCCDIGGAGSGQCLFLEDVDATNGEGNYCVSATENCEDFDGDEDACVAHENTGQCYWDDPSCVPRVTECSDYISGSDCDGDVQDISEDDPGCQEIQTVTGGVSIILKKSSCSCNWNTSVSGTKKCTLNQTAVTDDGSGNGGVPLGVCSRSLVLTETCDEGTGGFESYTREASYAAESGTTISAEAVGCVDTTGSRRCGEPVVKVPFFGGFEFLLSGIFITCMYCFMKREDDSE